MRQTSTIGLPLWVLLTLAFLAAGCSKSKLEFSDESSYSSSSLCVDKSSPGSPTPIRRLSKRELLSSLQDILGSSIYAAISDSLAVIPNDERGIKFDHVSNTVNFNHTESLFSAAEAIAEEIVNKRPSFFDLSPCLTATDDRACMKRFVFGLGYKLFRRPLQEQEVMNYMIPYESLRLSSKPDAMKVVIAAMFQSPHFYYIVETNGQPWEGRTDILKLSAYELATRLSYALTGSTPDDTLMAAAANGSLNTEAGFNTQIERLFSSPRGREHLREYVTQYLQLDMLPALSQSTTFLEGQSTAGLLSQIITEAQEYMLFHMIDKKSTFEEIMTSNIAFVPRNQLAQLYGVTAGTGPIVLPEERSGILTRAALLVAGDDEHRPFHRGQFIASRFLCSPVGRPNPDALPEAFSTAANPTTQSTRSYYEHITSAQSCMGCHSTINSFGFALENFDALGRYRTSEVKRDIAGVVTGRFPIDSNTHPRIDQREVSVSGAASLGRTLASSTQVQQCFSMNWFRFAFGKNEELATDGCAIEELREEANDSDRGLASFLKKTFKLRSFSLRVAPSN